MNETDSAIMCIYVRAIRSKCQNGTLETWRSRKKRGNVAQRAPLVSLPGVAWDWHFYWKQSDLARYPVQRRIKSAKIDESHVGNGRKLKTRMSYSNCRTSFAKRRSKFANGRGVNNLPGGQHNSRGGGSSPVAPPLPLWTGLGTAVRVRFARDLPTDGRRRSNLLRAGGVDNKR